MDDITRFDLCAVRSPTQPLRSEARLTGAALGLPLVDSIGAIRSHSATRISWHRHRVFELLFALEGVTVYELPDRKPIELRGGHFLTFPPGTVHRGKDNVREPAQLCGIVFDPLRAGAARNTPFTARDLSALAQNLRSDALTVRAMGGDLQRLVRQLIRRVEAWAPQTEPLAAAGLRAIVCSALLEATSRGPKSARPEAEAMVMAITARMQSRLADPISAEDLTKWSGYSRARLFQLFKEVTGSTPNDYLVRLRITAARELLTQTGQSITAIAHATGFGSSQYFSNVFRKYAGKTPTEYRSGGRHSS